MNNASRLSLIKARFAAKFGARLPGLIPVSKKEIKETVFKTVAPRITRSEKEDDSNDLPSLSSRLKFDSVVSPHSISESDFLLNAKEKRELSKVWHKKPAPAAPAAEQNETEVFAVQEVEDFIPAIDPVLKAESAAYVEAWTKFELDSMKEADKLLLMA